MKLNEDDEDELKSLKYRIKSVLLNPKSKDHEFFGCILEIEKIYNRFCIEGKTIPESDEYLCLDDMKNLVSEFSDRLIAAVELQEK